MAGEPITSPGVTRIRYKTKQNISIGLTAALAVEAGQLVHMSANLTVTPSTGATDVPIGVVEVPADAGKKATVRLFGDCTVEGVAKGGTLAAGAFVRQDGTKNGEGLNFVAAASGAVAGGRVLSGGAAGTAIVVLILQQPWAVA